MSAAPPHAMPIMAGNNRTGPSLVGALVGGETVGCAVGPVGLPTVTAVVCTTPRRAASSELSWMYETYCALCSSVSNGNVASS
jgi:hypothetical protein